MGEADEEEEDHSSANFANYQMASSQLSDWINVRSELIEGMGWFIKIILTLNDPLIQ